MSTATSRLRRTFKYPSDTDSQSTSRDELDEEEQEDLLSTLSTSASKNDSIYRVVFTVMPLLSIIPFLWNLVVHPSRSTVLPAMLAVTSLAITAWGMWNVQTDGALGKAGKRPSAIFSQQYSHHSSTSAPAASAHTSYEGPLTTYLPWLNAFIATLLLVLSIVFVTRNEEHTHERGKAVSEGFWLLLLLPAVMLGVVSVVKRSMLEIQSGLGELRGLRYEYKGA